MTDTSSDAKNLNPIILSYAKDLPNICSLSGLVCTIVAIYCSITGLYAMAMIGMVWVVAFDWADGGLIARRMKGCNQVINGSARNGTKLSAISFGSGTLVPLITGLKPRLRFFCS